MIVVADFLNMTKTALDRGQRNIRPHHERSRVHRPNQCDVATIVLERRDLATHRADCWVDDKDNEKYLSLLLHSAAVVSKTSTKPSSSSSTTTLLAAQRVTNRVYRATTDARLRYQNYWWPHLPIADSTATYPTRHWHLKSVTDDGHCRGVSTVPSWVVMAVMLQRKRRMSGSWFVR